MTRETKERVEAAVKEEKQCRLCNYVTSKRRIRIHNRQHSCMHFCHCGYKNISRDQVAEHQKYTQQPGHAREICRVYTVEEDQFPFFRKFMEWPGDTPLGALLPGAPRIMAKKDMVEKESENKGQVETAPRINSWPSTKKVTPTVTRSLRLPEGYSIPRAKSQKDVDFQDNTDQQADIPPLPPM